MRLCPHLQGNVVTHMTHFNEILVDNAHILFHFYDAANTKCVVTMFLKQQTTKRTTIFVVYIILEIKMRKKSNKINRKHTSFNHLSWTNLFKTCSVSFFFSFLVWRLSAQFKISVEEADPLSESTIRSIWKQKQHNRRYLHKPLSLHIFHDIFV